MNRFKISEEEYKKVRELEKKTKDKNISRRLKVLMLKYEGKKNKEIADIRFKILLMKWFIALLVGRGSQTAF